MRKALAIRHVDVEHLGSLEGILPELGFSFEYLDTSKGQVLMRSLEEYSLVVVLGGPMGVYEESAYPFLSYEMKLMEKTLALNIPLLGVCLGCQMLAKVLGSRVYKGDKGQELGWMEVYKVGEHPFFVPFPQRLKVFQWHGDTFDLPKGSQLIYSSDIYTSQAFVYNRSVGLQFHIEVDERLLKDWKKAYPDEFQEAQTEKEHLSKLRLLLKGLVEKLSQPARVR